MATADKRMIVGFIENGAIVRGYVKTHYLNAEGQETSAPRDVELTGEQIAAFNAADLAALLNGAS